MENLIPLRTADGSRIRGYYPAEDLERNRHAYELRYNRRNHLREAREKPSMSLDQRPNSTLGMEFEQRLSSGWCYALIGVTGSN